MQAFPRWQWFSSACFSEVGLVGQRLLMFLCFLIHFAEMLFRRTTYLSTLSPIRMSPKGRGREAPAHGPPVSMGGPGSQPRSATTHGMQLHFFHRGRSQRPLLPTLALCHELLGGKGNEGPQLEQIPTSSYQACCMVHTSLRLH